MKPVCAKCRLFFRPKRNGFAFEEGMPVRLAAHHHGDPAVPCAKATCVRWEAYKLWIGDLWECRGCGAQIVITMPTQQPVAEHFQKELYTRMLQVTPPQLRVNDC